jgi:hypothetical protein
MAVELPHWPRSHYEPGGGEASVLFLVFGEFSTEVRVSGAKYRTTGVPKGCDVRRLDREKTDEFPYMDGPMGEALKFKQSKLFHAARDAAECMVIRGSVPDPTDLNYMRDAVGLVMFFLYNGGVAALDPHQITLYDSARWHAEMFEPQPPQLNRHVVILVSEEDDPATPAPTSPASPAEIAAMKSASGRLWIHTRGMRKFGRPDLSLRNVPREQQVGAIDLCNRFIQMQVQGALIPEGQAIRIASLPEGLVCSHGGSVEDPDFNNVHLEIRWPLVS